MLDAPFTARGKGVAFVLLVGIIDLMGLLRTLLSSERVRALCAGGRTGGRAVGLGALPPFCSCSSLLEMLILRKVIRWPALAPFAAALATAFTPVGRGFNLTT